jgi:alkylation response protein AidB-like acyl-CoA dehydrogenase
VQAGAPATPPQQVRLRIAATHAATSAATAVDRLYTAAGSTAVLATSPLQRHLRDVHAITQHFFVALPTYEMLGRIVFGAESDGFML